MSLKRYTFKPQIITLWQRYRIQQFKKKITPFCALSRLNPYRVISAGNVPTSVVKGE